MSLYCRKDKAKQKQAREFVVIQRTQNQTNKTMRNLIQSKDLSRDFVPLSRELQIRKLGYHVMRSKNRVARCNL